MSTATLTATIGAYDAWGVFHAHDRVAAPVLLRRLPRQPPAPPLPHAGQVRFRRDVTRIDAFECESIDDLPEDGFAVIDTDAAGTAKAQGLADHSTRGDL